MLSKKIAQLSRSHKYMNYGTSTTKSILLYILAVIVKLLEVTLILSAIVLSIWIVSCAF